LGGVINAEIEYAHQTYSSKRYSIMCCQSCKSAIALPRPTAEELDKFYTSEYFGKSTSTDLKLGYVDYRVTAEENAKHGWKDLNAYTSLTSVTPKKLLDVGCATGGFLAEAQRSGEWECVGVEVSHYAVEVARKEFGLNVISGDIWSPSLEPNTFGLITMWHVLEHLINPFDALERARELLVSGGNLFIEIPNWNSLGRIIRGASWSQLKPPEHINFWNTHSLQIAVKKAGFEVVQCSTHYPTLMDKADIRRLTQPLYRSVAIVALVACKFGYGGYLRLVAQKS
jgi:2-polyprenyl-3-methyl-5-hydroxy-6-metoxy-1,4-benzoquinol methylase